MPLLRILAVAMVPMAYMLSLRSSERKIYAIDYDEEKIDLARNCELSGHCNIKFEVGDAIDCYLQASDVFLISNMLHYLTSEDQKLLLNKCINKLAAGGQIIIREGDIQLKKRNIRTKLSEYLSTKTGFNKTKQKLSFFSRAFIESIAENNGLDLSVIEGGMLISNQIYLLKRPNHEQPI